MKVHKRKGSNKLFLLWYAQNPKGVPGEPTIWFWPLVWKKVRLFSSELSPEVGAIPSPVPQSKVDELFEVVEVKTPTNPTLPTIPGVEFPPKVEIE